MNREAVIEPNIQSYRENQLRLKEKGISTIKNDDKINLASCQWNNLIKKIE